MKTFQQWYTPEMVESLWNHKNADEVAEAAYEAGQSTLNVLSAELSKTKHELEQLKKKLFKDKINTTMNSFDFHKVHKAMVALDWKWRDEGVPTIDSLKKTARKLLMDVTTNEYGNIMSGGFRADRHDGGELSLQFIVTESSSFED
jgi:hypothetical protein